MKKIALASLVLSLLVGSIGGVALAGHGHMGPMGMKHRGPDGDAGFYSHIADKLDLTEEQRESAKQIHEATFEKAGPIMEQHHAQMDEIETLLDAGTVSAQEIGTKLIAAHATKKQLKTLHEEAMGQFKALLTDEQKARFEEMDFGHMKMRMRHH